MDWSVCASSSTVSIASKTSRGADSAICLSDASSACSMAWRIDSCRLSTISRWEWRSSSKCAIRASVELPGPRESQ